MTEEISDSERAMLEQAMYERTVSRTRKQPKQPVRTREHISPEEYQQRLIRKMKQDELDAERYREKRLALNIAKWNSIVGERFRDAETNNPHIKKRVEMLKTTGDTHNSSVVLSGELGIGKTWLAYSYLNALVKEGVFNPLEIVASTEASVLGRIASGGYKRAEMSADLKDPLHKIFFIDDVGQAHFFNDSVRQEVWYELIDHIYINNLTLIMTTNKTFPIEGGKIKDPKRLENWLGSAAYDRMKHIMGPTGLIVPEGQNKRPAVYKQREERSRK